MNLPSLNNRLAVGRSWRGFVTGVAVLFLAVAGQAAVTLTSYQFTADNFPYIQAAATDLAAAQGAAGPGGYYKLRAKILVPWDPGYHHGIDSSSNLNSRLASVPGAGTYNVQLYWAAYNASGVFQATGPFNEQTIVISPPAAGNAGLMAEYFNGSSFGTLVRTAPSGETPNFDWGDRGPLSTGVDNFSARWTGYIEPLYSETYTITIGSDDGMRVYIDDMSTPLVGIWWDHGYFEDSRQIQFVAGRRYAIKVEFFENWGGAGAHLYWESNSQVRQEVPVTRLFPAGSSGGSPSQAPTIVTQPQGQTVSAGSLVYFTVVAIGSPWPTYQWRKNSIVLSGATAASYTISSVQPADAGGYDVVIMNSAGSVTSAVASLTVNSGGGGAGSGVGLRGDYYNGADFGSLVATRTDWQVNFDWGNGSPISGVGADYFSVRWSGQIEAPVSGYYTFSTNSDDGVRLKLNGATAIDDWTAHPAYDRFSTQVHLQAGSKTTVVLEYFENGGGANVQFYWQPPGQTNRVLIPRDRLYSAIAPGGGSGWQTLNAESRSISFTGGSDKDGNAVWLAQPVEHYLSVPSNGTLRIYTTGNADTVGLLRNSDGSVILETWLDTGGDGGNFRLERAINAGTYVLQMVARFAGDVVEDYTAYVEFLPATGSVTAPSVTSGAAAAGTVGAAFSGYTVTASGSAPISYSVANLPPGLGITAASGSVTGTPTVAGTFTATVTAINAAGSNTKAVTFTIAAAAGGGSSAAAGGSVTRVGDYLVHTFSSSGIFSLPSTRNCDVLVVAGGGGGGQGGGGGGGFNFLPGLSVPAGSFTVSVGYGGASASPWGTGNNGADSQFGSFLVAHGGGGGGGPGGRGNSGGSGGGAGRDANTSSGGSAAWGGEGNTGGGAPSDGWCSSGGGGGAGSAGGSGNSFIYTDDKGGDGGNGRSSDITGGSIFYAGGGGGTNESGGGALPVGGMGGGGAGSRSYQYGVAGTNGLGGGGGAGAAGGSGVVIVRYYSPVVMGTAPSMTSGATATGTVGSAFFSYTVSASGTTPMSYSSSGLPPGLSLNAGSGAVSGTPTTVGSYPVQFTATNVAGSAVKTVTFTIAAGLVAPVAFSAEQVTSTRFLASWSPVAGATGYRLDVSINPSFTNPILNDFAVTYLANGQTIAGTSYTVSRTAGNTEYWYRVRAVTSAGTSPNSSSIFVPASGTASASPPASLWFDMPLDLKVNGVWTKVYDGVPDEIIASGGVRGLTYYVLDWRYTGGNVTFSDYSTAVNDWWYLRNGYVDINGDGSTDFSSADFTSWWIPGITFSYPGETYFRLGVEFNPEPGQLYDVCYSTNTVISASSLSLVSGGVGISSETNARLVFALLNEFTATELDHGSLYLVRRVFAPSGVQVNLPIIGDVALRKGIGGASGVITLPGDVTITASATSATISKAGAGAVTVSNGAISGAVNLGAGYVLGGVSNGNLSLTLPSGAVVSTGPGGTTLSIPGGGTITVSAAGSIGMTVPAGSAAALRTAVDQLGILLGLGVSSGPSASVKILPSGSSPGSAIWESANGILLGNRPAGDYSVGMKETNAPDDRAVWITLTVQPARQKVLLLLHGMNSNTDTWTPFVNAAFGGTSPSSAVIRDRAFLSPVAPTPNANGVLCYRLQFGFFDAESTRTGLEGVTAANTSGYLVDPVVRCGDFETFTQLGREVDDAIALLQSPARHPNAEIVLLGHSRGGIAARTFLQTADSSPRKAAVVGLLTTSSPHLGSRMGRIWTWLNTHRRGTPESFNDDWQVVDWLRDPIVRTLLGVALGSKSPLDVRRPVILDLSDESAAIRDLNSQGAVRNLPRSVRYGEVLYDAANLGLLALTPVRYSVFEESGIGGTLFPQLSGPASSFLLEGRSSGWSLFRGDGLIPAQNQEFTFLPDFAGIAVPVREVQNREVVHTDATSQVDDLLAQLRLVAPTWFP